MNVCLLEVIINDIELNRTPTLLLPCRAEMDTHPVARALPAPSFVAPAQAGVRLWIPACAGMTGLGGKSFMVRRVVPFMVNLFTHYFY